MFMKDHPLTQYCTEQSGETSVGSPDAPGRQNDYQRLLDTVDAARAGLAWGEHDYEETSEVDVT